MTPHACFPTILTGFADSRKRCTPLEVLEDHNLSYQSYAVSSKRTTLRDVKDTTETISADEFNSLAIKDVIDYKLFSTTYNAYLDSKKYAAKQAECHAAEVEALEKQLAEAKEANNLQAKASKSEVDAVHKQLLDIEEEQKRQVQCSKSEIEALNEQIVVARDALASQTSAHATEKAAVERKLTFAKRVIAKTRIHKTKALRKERKKNLAVSEKRNSEISAAIIGFELVEQKCIDSQREADQLREVYQTAESHRNQLQETVESVCAERDTALATVAELENRTKDEDMEDAGHLQPTHEELAQAITNGNNLEKQLQQQQSENTRLLEELKRLKASKTTLDSDVQFPSAIPSPPEDQGSNNGGMQLMGSEVGLITPSKKPGQYQKPEYRPSFDGQVPAEDKSSLADSASGNASIPAAASGDEHSEPFDEPQPPQRYTTWMDLHDQYLAENPPPTAESESDDGEIPASESEIEQPRPPVRSKVRAKNHLSKARSSASEKSKRSRIAKAGITKSSKTSSVTETGMKRPQKPQLRNKTGLSGSARRSDFDRPGQSTTNPRHSWMKPQLMENATQAPLKAPQPKSVASAPPKIVVPPDSSKRIVDQGLTDDFIKAYEAYEAGDHKQLRRNGRSGLSYILPSSDTLMWFSPHRNYSVYMAHLIMSDIWDPSKNFYLPATNELKYLDETDYRQGCLMAQLPETHVAAVRIFQEAAKAKRPQLEKLVDEFTQRRPYRPQELETNPKYVEPLHKVYQKTCNELATLPAFQHAAIAWADGAKSEGRYCWPARFSDPLAKQKTTDPKYWVRNEIDELAKSLRTTLVDESPDSLLSGLGWVSVGGVSNDASTGATGEGQTNDSVVESDPEVPVAEESSSDDDDDNDL